MAASLVQHLSKIRSPLGGEKVFKDECAYSFDTPDCETGLYICMSTFLGFGKKHVERHFKRTGNAVYLHIKRIMKEVERLDDDPPKKKPTKLAIGVEGGFDIDETRFKFEEFYTIVVLPEWTMIPIDAPDLPPEVVISSQAIIASESAAKQEEAAALAGTWDGEKRIISKHAENLPQLEPTKKIPPMGWKCERCDKTDNLWLNLTDGSILCGRKFWDGSGGNNHAVDHYQQVKYPLAVKLGTITPDGADVYSYDEDDMVEDPFLARHLAHWGINIAAMQKTEKTMLELEIDLNQKIGEWDVIQEAGSKLEPIYGPGYTGIRNLGNSCYMNSVMQVMFTIPDFKKKYADAYEAIYAAGPVDPTGDFNCQMAKLGHGLLSGDYSKPPAEVAGDGSDAPKVPSGLRPLMYKTLIGRGHPEFSTKRQQDAQEFLLHLISVIERNCVGSTNPADSLKFEVEERVKCVSSGKVRYTKRSDYLLSLPIPLEAASNMDEVHAYEKKKKELEEQKKVIDPKEIVRPRISLADCLEVFSKDETVEDFFSTAINAKSIAQKTTRLSSFPDYLMIHLKKFTIGEDWVPKKLDVSIDVPEELDIKMLRGRGLQPGEEELPEEKSAAEAEVQIDEAVVAQLVDMGFAYEGCKKAVYHTKNSGIEAAMNWTMEHMGDPDFAEPLVVPGRKEGGSFTPNEEAISMILAMGFTRDQAIKALKATDNNLERAADWIFSHAHELDTPMETDQAEAAPQPAQQPTFRDGEGKYKLVAFISHMGTSTMVGHYVCHIFREGRWIIYNDEKVALSEHPPKDLAYLYLYQRV